ncbi:MAG TPA: efflux transporter outer membrane subunit [Rubrivivax sp.]|nr:efflux transporter outer membrane subunit [Rubrivivax sp.]
MIRFPYSVVAALGGSLLLGACSLFAPPVALPPLTPPPIDAAPAWQAPLPAGGGQSSLLEWWKQFDDPVLVELINTSQAASPSIAAAASRIEQARAASVSAGALLLPGVNANASASTGRADVGQQIITFAGANLQASWELDLFGANQAARNAAVARLEGTQAGWYEVRIAVAAEVAATYNSLRSCEALVIQTEADTRSRAETARITELGAQAGLFPPANAALARASAAQGRSLLAGQKAACDLLVKSLVALSAMDEPTLRRKLASRSAQLPQPAAIAVRSVPAAALMQRPDLLSAERLVIAAAADTAQSQALRYPRVMISGSVGPALLRVESSSINGNLWTIGPVQVALPLFDGGALAANVVAARARYDEALSAYRGLVRTAVREVEAALVTLESSARRVEDTKIAVEGFEASLRATDARFRGGLGSLFDLEEARRSALISQSSLIELQREYVAAWINLYRALGGGWTIDTPPPAPLAGGAATAETLAASPTGAPATTR